MDVGNRSAGPRAAGGGTEGDTHTAPAPSHRLRAEPRLAHGLERAARAVRLAVECERCTIHLIEGDDLVVIAADPPLLLGPRAARRRVGEGLAGRVAAERAPVYLADVAAQADHPAREGLSADARTYFGVPLEHRGRLLGVLQVEAALGDAYEEDDRVRIESLARRVAASLADLLVVPSAGAGEAARVLAHELRRPLTALRGLAATLAERAGRLPRGTIRELARRIHAASVRLEGLVADLLDLARSERGAIPVEIRDSQVGPILVDLASEPSAHRISLDLDPGLPAVRADPRRLRQVLENLVSNARRFSPEGSSIRLHAHRDGDRVLVGVEDRGVGIREEDRERIFEPFYQAHAEAAPGGLGIGLSLVRDLCEAMGARVRVETEVGVGSTFTVSLPVASPN